MLSRIQISLRPWRFAWAVCVLLLLRLPAVAEAEPSVAAIHSAQAALAGGSPAERREAVALLVKAGAGASRAYDPLLAALGDSDPWVRWGAAQAIANLGGPKSSDLKALGDLAGSDPDPRVRFAALEGLIRHGNCSVSATSPLLSDPSPSVRLQALRLLAWTGRPSWRPLLSEARRRLEENLSALEARLADEDLTVRLAAIGTLESYGVWAFPVLAAALEDDHVFVRRAAARSIADQKALGTGRVAAALIKGLDDLDLTTRAACFEALEVALSGTESAQPKLVATLLDRSQESSIRRSAALALRHLLDEPGSEILDAYARVLETSSDDELVKSALIPILARRGAKSAPLASSLAAIHRDRSASAALRGQAERALIELGPQIKKEQGVLWWVLPRAYGWELLGLLAVLALWFGFASRYPKGPAPSRRLRVGHFLQVWIPATLLATQATHHVVTLPWAAGFLPEPFLVLLPLPWTMVLSTGFLCALAALWATQRRPWEDASALALPEAGGFEPPGVVEAGEGLGPIPPEQGELGSGLGQEVLDA